LVVEAEYEWDVNHNGWNFREASNAYGWGVELEKRMGALLFCSL
jgi:hypothetical protein